MKRIVELDGVRTLAVGMVITCHFAPFANWFNQFAGHNGGLGVDIFFVLSGFLITTILLGSKNQEHPYEIFYARRFLRIMPPYLLLLVIVYGIAFFAHDVIEPKKFIGQLLFLRSFSTVGEEAHRLIAVIHNPHLIPNPFAVTIPKFVDRDYPILPITGSLGPTWSLSVEEWFYVLWAPVVLMLRRPAIVAIGFFLCFTGFLLRWFISPSGILRSGDILIAGALLAIWIEYRKTLPVASQAKYDRLFDAATLVAGAIFVTLTLLQRDLMAMTFAEILFAGGVAWLIRHANSANPLSSFLRWKPIVWVGSISYTLYLIHLPMYFLVRAAITRILGEANAATEVRYWIVALTTIVLALIFSWLSWQFFEAPILSYKEHLTDWITSRHEQKATTV